MSLSKRPTESEAITRLVSSTAPSELGNVNSEGLSTAVTVTATLTGAVTSYVAVVVAPVPQVPESVLMASTVKALDIVVLPLTPEKVGSLSQ